MLTILETASQVDWYAEQRNKASRSAVLALTATAAYACQKRSLPYLKLEDHCNYAHRLIEYDEVLKDFIKWEMWLDDWARENVQEFRATSFRPANAVSFLLQFLLAEIWATTTNLRELLAGTQPDRVAYWSTQTITVPWWLHPCVHPATELLKHAAGPEIKLVDLSREFPALSPQQPVTPPLSVRVRMTGRLKAYLRESNLFSKIETVQKFGMKPFLTRAKICRPRILVSGSGYDLEPVIHHLYASGARITRLRDNLHMMDSGRAARLMAPNLRKQLVDSWPRLEQRPELWKPLEIRGIGRTELLSRALDFWWHKLTPVLWLRYQEVASLIKREKITALMTVDAGGTTWGGPSCQAALAAGSASLIFQHGGSIGIDACLWQSFLRASDAFFVAGDGVTRDLERTRPTFLTTRCRVIAVGASRLDKLRERNSPRRVRKLREELQAGDPRPIIMYVPTIFGTYGRSISDVAGLPDVSYLELLQSVLGRWKKMPEVRLLYKDLAVANDWTRVVPEFIAENIPNGSVTTRRLSDLAWAVDGIIVDHAITALSEVLLTKKRLVVYVPKPHKSPPEALALLRKRANVAETAGEFISSVETFLTSGDFSEISTPNDEALRMYATYMNDGRSAARAAEAVIRWPGVIRSRNHIVDAKAHSTLEQFEEPDA